MFGKLIFATAVVLGGVALSAPVLAIDHHGLRGDGFSPPRSHLPRGTGFAGPRDVGSGQFLNKHGGYDGDGYWSRDNCFPTEPGGCD